MAGGMATVLKVRVSLAEVFGQLGTSSVVRLMTSIMQEKAKPAAKNVIKLSMMRVLKPPYPVYRSSLRCFQGGRHG